MINHYWTSFETLAEIEGDCKEQQLCTGDWYSSTSPIISYLNALAGESDTISLSSISCLSSSNSCFKSRSKSSTFSVVEGRYKSERCKAMTVALKVRLANAPENERNTNCERIQTCKIHKLSM